MSRSFVALSVAFTLVGVVAGSAWCTKAPTEVAPTSGAPAPATPGTPGTAGAEGKAAGVAKVEPSAVAADPAAGLPDARELLRETVVAMGGQEKLEAIESYRYVAKVTVPGQNISGKIEVWWKKGDFYSETNIAGVGRIRAGRSGDTVWSEDPIHGLRQLQGREAAQAKWGSEVAIAATWSRHFDSATTVGKRSVAGRDLYDVALRGAGGDELIVAIDAQTQLPVAQKFKQANPLGEMPVSIDLEDYRDVQGLKISYRQNTDTGIAKMVQELETIDFGAEVDARRFAMPASSGAVAETSKTATAAGPRTGMPIGPDGKPGRPVPPRPHDGARGL